MDDTRQAWPDLNQLSRDGLVAFIRRLLSTLHSRVHVPEDVLLKHTISAFEFTVNQRLHGTQQSLGGQPAVSDRMVAASPEPVQPMYSLQLSHNCMAQGCNDESCKMCRFNPLRKCKDMFRKPPHAYTTDDPIVAQCQGPLLISIHDQHGNRLSQCPAQLQGCVILVVALQSRKMSRNSPDLVAGRAPPLEQIHDYILNKPRTGRSLQSLITADNAISPHQHAADPRSRGSGASPPPDSIFVTVNSSGSYTFKNLKLRHSCEALMPGKKPTVRLMFVLADPRGNPAFSEVPQVSGVISEEFLVTTCRAKGRGDGGSLLYTTKVSFLPGVGQETERKLANLADSCPPLAAAQIVYPDSITTVGDLVMLMHAIEDDNDAKQHLKSCLKLDDPIRWNRLREAVNTAVAVDNRIRVFCSTSHAGSDGDDLFLLFNANEGRIYFDQKAPHDSKHPDPPSILGILTRAAGSNNMPTFVRMKDLSETHQNVLYSIMPDAQCKWMTRGHPGWFISDWSAPIAARQGLLVNAEAGDMPVQLPQLSIDSQMQDMDHTHAKHHVQQQMSSSPSAQQFLRSPYSSQPSHQSNGDNNSIGSLHAPRPSVPRISHAEATSKNANTAVRRSTAPAEPPPLFSLADSAPLPAHPPHDSDLATALSGGLSGSLGAADNVAATAAPHPRQNQQQQTAGHARMNLLQTHMLPPGDAIDGCINMAHSSAAESLTSQLAQLREATIPAATAMSHHQHQQKRRLSSGPVHALPGQLPAQPRAHQHHGQLPLPEFEVGAGAQQDQIFSGMLAAYAHQHLQSHPLSPEQQEEQRRSLGSGLMFQ